MHNTSRNRENRLPEPNRPFPEEGLANGFDVQRPTNCTDALKPLLDDVGVNPNLMRILSTPDETAIPRELALLAGANPSLKLGLDRWFFDSPEGMMRYRQLVTEFAGFYSTADFYDDSRAFYSMPVWHDMARRVDCEFPADYVVR